MSAGCRLSRDDCEIASQSLESFKSNSEAASLTAAAPEPIFGPLTSLARGAASLGMDIERQRSAFTVTA
jgi:hypothetical protein